MKKITVFLSLLVCCGCASLWDAPKNILGFSTRDIEQERSGALYQSFEGERQDVFGAVLDIAQENKYYVSAKDEIRGLVILMEIPGAVNTTEVGVFVTSLSQNKGVKVELSSRSTPAKKAVAQVLFVELGKRFSKI